MKFKPVLLIDDPRNPPERRTLEIKCIEHYRAAAMWHQQAAIVLNLIAKALTGDGAGIPKLFALHNTALDEALDELDGAARLHLEIARRWPDL